MLEEIMKLKKKEKTEPERMTNKQKYKLITW